MNPQICLFLVILGVLSEAAPVEDVTKDPYAEDMAHRKQIALDCIKQLNIDKSMIAKILEVQLLTQDPSLLPRDKIYKDFLTCSYKKQGYQSEEGTMLYGNVKEFLSRYYDGKDLELVNECKTSVSGTEHGEIAFNALLCIMDKLKQIEKNNQKEIDENTIQDY